MLKILATLACAFGLVSAGAAFAQSAPSTALLAPHNAPQVLFWMNDRPDSVNSFLQHKDKIGILSPTWYHIEDGGLVSGGPQPMVLKVAQQNKITLLPLFELFNAPATHRLVNDQHSQDELVHGLLRECQQYGYPGVNLDIEDVMWNDRDGLTALVARVSEALHKQNLLVTIDVVPYAPGYPGSGEFSRWMYSEWRGGYDMQALAASVDLLCLMTYDQHSRWTPPGPVGGWEWTVKNMDMALKLGVPPQKLSLGIAAYGRHWYTGDPGFNKEAKKPNPSSDSISAVTAHYYRDSYGAKEQWDEIDHEPYFFFSRDDTREWVFYTDRRSFMDRFDLAHSKNLEGVCSWVLGDEDPAIWAALPKAR